MTTRTSAELTGAGLIVLSAICFGTLGPLTRFAEAAGVAPLPLVTWRAAIGAGVLLAALLVAAAWGGRRLQRPGQVPRRARWLIAGAAISNAVVNLAMFIAFLRIGIGLALLIFYLYPAYLAVISVTWFGERLDRMRWAALGLALVGMILVVGGEGLTGTVDLLGIGLALMAGIGQCFYALAVRHGFAAIRGGEAAVVTMSGAALVYVAIAIGLGDLGELAAPLESVHAAWPVLLASVVGAAIPTLCFISGIRLLGPARAAILSMIEPVVGTVLAAILLAELPTTTQVAGGALIIAAAILLQRRAHDLAEHEAVAD